MKTLHKLSGIIAVATLVIATGCISMTTVGGTTDMHGLISGYPAADSITKDSHEIGSYAVVLGLFDMGYEDYVAKVKIAKTQGKTVTTKTMTFIIASKTTAYAK